MKRVLILDDDEDLLFVLNELCSSLGASQCLAGTSFAELQKNRDAVAECQLDLLDVNLGPEVPNGLDAYLWLKDVQFQGEIMFLTGHASTHPLVQRAKQLQGVRVLNKPLSIDQLEKILQGISP